MRRTVRFDDLDDHEKDAETLASSTRHVGLDGLWVELDLTEEHDAELLRVLERYLAAGHKPVEPPAVPNPRRGGKGGKGPGQGLGGKIAEAHARNEAEAAWLRAHDYPVTIRVQGGYYFPVESHRAYQAHLDALATANGAEASA